MYFDSSAEVSVAQTSSCFLAATLDMFARPPQRAMSAAEAAGLTANSSWRRYLQDKTCGRTNTTYRRVAFILPRVW